jgi:hypothetical protein
VGADCASVNWSSESEASAMQTCQHELNKIYFVLRAMTYPADGPPGPRRGSVAGVQVPGSPPLLPAGAL